MRQERRRFVRAPQPFRARYHLYGELMESWRDTTTVNLSASGMRFRCGDPVESGAVLEIELTIPSVREVLTLSGRVVWSQSVASGVSEVGVQFADVTPEQEQRIDELVKFLLKGMPPSGTSS